MNTVELMQAKLALLQPSHVEIIDDSAKHANHAGAKSGGGHYRLDIISTHFANQNTLARHRLVYATLGDLMQQQIHALTISALTPAEV
jgi:BolA protein